MMGSSSELSQFHTPSMAKHGGVRSKSSSFLTDCSLFLSGAVSALFLIWAFSSFIGPTLNLSPTFSTVANEPTKTNVATDTTVASTQNCADSGYGINMLHDPPIPTFYDDPYLSYSIEKPLKKWDQRRQQWLKLHPSFATGARDRVLVVTGSQPYPCNNSIGDHLLLRLFKNKVDYSRIHGHDIFYNNLLLQPKMSFYWAKIPVVRAAMVAHPEVEWVWWVDSDAVFTDMDFKLPLDKYVNHNLVVHGYAEVLKEMKSWTSLNAGVFLIRNCQWSLDFMEVWASMGPQTPDYHKWSETLRTTFTDKMFPESDDQTALLYLLLKEKEKWGNKIFIETEFYFEGYWVDLVGTLDNVTAKYMEIEKGVRVLRRRHAEKVSESYSSVREEHVKVAGSGSGIGSLRRPFITHFTGCQPCSGDHNKEYAGESCWNGMQRALNFADNQVLRNFGYVHPDLLNSTLVSPLPFDFPA